MKEEFTNQTFFGRIALFSLSSFFVRLSPKRFGSGASSSINCSILIHIIEIIMSDAICHIVYSFFANWSDKMSSRCKLSVVVGTVVIPNNVIELSAKHASAVSNLDSGWVAIVIPICTPISNHHTLKVNFFSFIFLILIIIFDSQG